MYSLSPLRLSFHIRANISYAKRLVFSHQVFVGASNTVLRPLSNAAFPGSIFQPINLHKTASYFRLRNTMSSVNHGQQLSELRLGFVGTGQISQAIVNGLLSTGLVKGSNVTLGDVVGPEAATFYAPIKKICDTYGAAYHTVNGKVIEKSDVLFVCVKPNVILKVLQENAELCKGKLVISVAAGVPIEAITSALAGNGRVIRVMPNTPCLVKEGAGVFSRGPDVSEADVSILIALLSSIFPALEEIPEYSFNAASALSGSGPAYVYMVIESLADGGVRMGLPRTLANKLAVQTVYGAAAMVKQIDQHPAQLKDNVCSPGGSTIAGVYALERGGVRAAFIDAIEAAKKRNDELAPPKK